jgi:hypothetical protein
LGAGDWPLHFGSFGWLVERPEALVHAGLEFVISAVALVFAVVEL